MTLLEEQLYISTILEMYKPKSYTQLEKMLIEAVNRITEDIHKTEGRWSRASLRSTQRLILKELQVPFSKIESLLVDDMEFVAQMSIGTFFVSKEAIKSISRLDLTTQGYSVYELLSDNRKGLTKKLQTQLAVGVAAGDSINDMVRQVRQTVTGYTNSQLKTVIRTTLAEVNSQVHYKAYDRLESRDLIQGYEYVATLDGRTTEGCRVRDGRVFRTSISNIKDADKPPRHFNCRSILVPTTDFAIGESGYRSSIGGPVPKGVTYEKWFKGLSETNKRNILGKKYYELYKNGNFNVNKLSDVVSVRNLSDKGVERNIQYMLDTQ